ncbi:glutaredoxin family protein [Prochlorothrix hollandica]|uniref:Glutaredoxin n=1 Tax=Prochlorothrix hollandica PCC 9006 = CALU 1027 TaxID=317619 RepID=A0A0M2PZ71_PROHO|nr:glutaredoxin family protein [Prochlorothrix hollandica]KKJ00353.1 glutaredoxin [Prochlorothrix hollandica PCC 9006 = CALU 1027]
MDLILYSKPGCHLCEGLEEKLRSLTDPPLTLEVRDIRTNDAWLLAYELEIPVLCRVTASGQEQPLPRLSPRSGADQIAQMLQKYNKAP